MTTEAAVITETPSAAPPAFVPATSEAKTPEEIAYFKSRGADVEGLTKPAATNGTNGQEPKPAEQAAETVEAAVDVDPDKVVVGADGKARDANGRFVKTVPFGVFHSTRERLKETRGEADKLRENLIQTRERLNILSEVLPKGPDAAAQRQEAEKPIDPSEDFLGAFAQMMKKVSQLEGRVTETTTQTKDALTQRDLHDAFKQDVVRYASQKPEFAAAYNYLVERRHSELEALGYTNQAERDKAIAHEAREIAIAALDKKMSPAEVLHKIATARGFVAKPAVDPDAAKKEAQKEIERVNSGQAATVSIGKSGTGGVPEQLTQAKLANMGDDAYRDARTSYITKNGRAAWNKLIGSQ